MKILLPFIKVIELECTARKLMVSVSVFEMLTLFQDWPSSIKRLCYTAINFRSVSLSTVIPHFTLAEASSESRGCAQPDSDVDLKLPPKISCDATTFSQSQINYPVS